MNNNLRELKGVVIDPGHGVHEKSKKLKNGYKHKKIQEYYNI